MAAAAQTMQNPAAAQTEVAVQNFQAFATNTLGEWQHTQPALASKSWWEPLGTKTAGAPAPKAGGTPSAALTTLYRSPDIHARIVAMSKWFFPHDAYNELLQMIGECYGNGRLVEPTFTLLEGQAIANNPIFAGKAQQLGVTAFYDYVFTIDWMSHRLDMVDNILNTLQGLNRGAGNLGDVRFFQEQLDAMLMSPHRVPWFAWDNPRVQSLLVDQIDPKFAVAKSKEDEEARLTVKMFGYPVQQPSDLVKYVENLQTKMEIKQAPSKDNLGAELDIKQCFVHALHEALLLASPLWNELCAIGQGLFRVYLTKATLGVGFGTGSIAQGAFVNAFELGQLPTNVFPVQYPEENKVLSIGVQDFSSNRNDIEEEYRGFFSTPTHKVTSLNKEVDAVSAKFFLDESAVLRGFIQPKCIDLTLFAFTDNGNNKAVDAETPEVIPAMSLLLPPATVASVKKLEPLTAEAQKQAVLDSLKHTGMGGAIGTFLCNGTTNSGRFFDGGFPCAMVAPSSLIEKAMTEQHNHPIHFCPQLAQAMRRGVTFGAADMSASKLDAYYRPKSAPQHVFDYLRSRLRELESRYGVIRNAQANESQHPVATADQIFLDHFLGYGPHAKLPQCPAGTLPMIFDSIHKKTLTPEQWQRQIVRINGEPMLPAHLQVSGCLPARRADSEPNPVTSTTNVFKGLLDQLKP
jgi:hypothetical protein